VDSLFCPLLQAIAATVNGPEPDEEGVAYVDPDGDLYLLGELTWDCPPYFV
jgi:hypothetical protein